MISPTLEDVIFMKYNLWIASMSTYKIDQKNAKNNKLSVSIVFIGSDIQGIISFMSLSSLARKKLENSIKKSRGSFMIQKMISYFFIGNFT